MLAVLKMKLGVLTQEELLQSLFSQAGTSVTVFPCYLGAVSPTNSALDIWEPSVQSCFKSLPARPADLGCRTTLMMCHKPFSTQAQFLPHGHACSQPKPLPGLRFLSLPLSTLVSAPHGVRKLLLDIPAVGTSA